MQGRPDPNGTRTKEYNDDNSKSYYVIPPKKIVVNADYRPLFGDEISFKSVIYFSRKTGKTKKGVPIGPLSCSYDSNCA